MLVSKKNSKTVNRFECIWFMMVGVQTCFNSLTKLDHKYTIIASDLTEISIKFFFFIFKTILWCSLKMFIILSKMRCCFNSHIYFLIKYVLVSELKKKICRGAKDAIYDWFCLIRLSMRLYWLRHILFYHVRAHTTYRVNAN